RFDLSLAHQFYGFRQLLSRYIAGAGDHDLGEDELANVERERHVRRDAEHNEPAGSAKAAQAGLQSFRAADKVQYRVYSLSGGKPAYLLIEGGEGTGVNHLVGTQVAYQGQLLVAHVNANHSRTQHP